MTIDLLPPVPTTRSARDVFDIEANAFFGAFPTFASQLNALAIAFNMDSTTGISTTSLAIGTGSKSLTVPTDKSFQPGMSVKIAYTTTPTNWMHGTITSYNAGTGVLVVSVTNYSGSGTYAAWTVTLSAPINTDLGLWAQTIGTFTATPASTSTLTMTSDLTAIIKPRTTLSYIIGGVTYYGVVGAITSNLLTVWGAPLSGNVTALYYGGGRLRQVNVMVPGLYEDWSNTALIASDLDSAFLWALPTSYLVHYRAYSKTHDSTTHGQASVRMNNTEVNTVAGGLTIAADATWYSTAVDIAVLAYDINPGETLEVTAVRNGAGDAANLTITMLFVTP